jgi:hypothetical protein
MLGANQVHVALDKTNRGQQAPLGPLCHKHARGTAQTCASATKLGHKHCGTQQAVIAAGHHNRSWPQVRSVPLVLHNECNCRSHKQVAPPEQLCSRHWPPLPRAVAGMRTRILTPSANKLSNPGRSQPAHACRSPLRCLACFPTCCSTVAVTGTWICLPPQQNTKTAAGNELPGAKAQTDVVSSVLLCIQLTAATTNESQ